MNALRADGISSILARGMLFCFSVLTAIWTFSSVPVFWRQYPLELFAKRIIAGDAFKIQFLYSIQNAYSGAERVQERTASARNAAAIINLRMLEQTIASSQLMRLDSLMAETDETIRRSLFSAPADPMLWVVLFWLENTRNGFSSKCFELLNMSYSTGPNEGWVAVRRNRFALATYSSLKPDLASNAVREFAHLVSSNFFVAAADILEGPGWPIRDLLLSSLNDVDEVRRQTFAALIYQRGINLAVPGVDRPDWRPWH